MDMDREHEESKVDFQDEVTLTFAEDIEQAREYEALLKSNDIPAIVKEKSLEDGSKEIAIMVPEEFLDEAHVIVESQGDYDDFYEAGFEEESEDDDIYGDDFLDDSF